MLRIALSEFIHLTDLAAERLGSRVIYANDEFFAEKENLLKAGKPVFIEDRYTDRGKWMDGWETRRRRAPGNDFCIVRLGLPGVIRGVVVDTSFFRGNYPSHCSLEACVARDDAAPDELLSPATRWREILPRCELAGDSLNRFPVYDPLRATHLRFHIYPDGGVARLRVHGEALPDWKRILAAHEEVDLAAAAHGARIVACSNMFFSQPLNLLMPGRGARMDDGWETKRRRGPGNDWVVIALGIAGAIRRVEVDTAHFKGNFPESCSLEVCRISPEQLEDSPDSWPWRELLPRVKLGPDTLHTFSGELKDAGSATHSRFNIFPDGGVSRLRLFGSPCREGRRAAAVLRLDTMLPEEAETLFAEFLGARHWARHMAAQRPFRDAERLFAAADRAAAALSREDWLEAFARHPRIGESRAPAGQSAAEQQWSEQEQAAAAKSGEEARAALAAASINYEARFGHVFLICAAGNSSEEILVNLRSRMANDPEVEMRVASSELRKIARLRLEKWMDL
jgi:allantoicase